MLHIVHLEIFYMYLFKQNYFIYFKITNFINLLKIKMCVHCVVQRN